MFIGRRIIGPVESAAPLTVNLRARSHRLGQLGELEMRDAAVQPRTPPSACGVARLSENCLLVGHRLAALPSIGQHTEQELTPGGFDEGIRMPRPRNKRRSSIILDMG